MSIEVRRVDEGSGWPCESRIEDHRKDGAPHAELRVSIGETTSTLCLGCARKTFNALGFMVMSITGESIQQLVGLRKRKG